MAVKNKQNQKNTEGLTRYLVKPIIIIIIILLLLEITSATVQIQLIEQTNLLEYREIQKITLNITSNPSITQALIEFDAQNHSLEKQGQLYTYSWVPQHLGANTYKIHAKNSLNESQIYINGFDVQDTTPPEIIETQPQGILDYNLIELKVITNENSTCKYSEEDVSYDSMQLGLNGLGTIHTLLRSFGDGSYVFYTKCKDTQANTGQSQTINFATDTNPPMVHSITPTGTVNQEQNTLRFYTDEIATCRWGKSNQAYENLDNQFQTTGAKIHEQPLALIEGINTYYVSCKDQIGHFNEPAIIINLELNTPPTASISIDKNDSYKALTGGTYEVSLITSEHLSQAPNLRLAYSNNVINIPMEGGSDTWNGYLILPKGPQAQVGEFLFYGVDTKGIQGTEITNGKLILIDTQPPPAPRNLRLTNENNKIKLSWDYDGEEIDHFNIYRSTTGNTGQSDFQYTSEDKAYYDASVTNKIGYFYRISAVDTAGNMGVLSEEEFLMTEHQNASVGFIQDSELLAIINTNINHIEKIVQNLEVKITELEETTDQNLLQIINEQELVSKQKEVKSKIQTLIGELKTYRETKIAKDELNTKIAVITAKVKENEKDIISAVRLKNKVQNEQVIDESIVQKTIEEYVKTKALTSEQKNEYYKRTRKLQEEVRILQELIIYEIEYEYKESEKITLIKETILFTNELRGVVVQEFIPKDVLKISELTFTITPSEINTIGVVWLLNDLENSEVSYRLFDEKELNQLQKIKTILLYDIDEFLGTISEEKLNVSSQITGEAVAESKKKFSLTRYVLIPVGIIIILALLVYYFIFLKSEGRIEDEIITKIDEQEKQALKNIKIPENRQPSEQAQTGSSQEGPSQVVQSQVFQSGQSDLDIIYDFIKKSYQGLERQDLNHSYDNYYLALSHYKQASLAIKDRLRVNLGMNTLAEHIKQAVNKK